MQLRRFYLKDVDDEYETYEFDTSGGKVKFFDNSYEDQHPEITNEVETFCGKCAWHGKFAVLK
jgi:hypothetical protein